MYKRQGSLVGATIGNNVSFNTQGLEFSMTALFIVIVINQIKNNSNHLATLIGFFVRIISLINFGSDNFVIFSMILGFVMFQQIPDFYSWIGYLVICLMAVLMFFYNKKRGATVSYTHLYYRSVLSPK